MERWPLDTPWSSILAQIPHGESVVLGLMSGTSLDGLDCCLARIVHSPALPWQFEILDALTYPYPQDLQKQLRQSPKLSPPELMALDVQLGKLWGEHVLDFLHKHHQKNPHEIMRPLLIASHGHTVCHHPSSGYSLQIGSAAHLNALTGIPVLYDFRSGDIATGGQGAPLVPIGDAMLFGDYDVCLNLGGIANISWGPQPDPASAPWRKACDLTFCNTALNSFASLAGLNMDKDGQLASQGSEQPGLLDIWSSATWYQTHGARSLDTSTFQHQFGTQALYSQYSPQDLCYNWCLHVADVLGNTLQTISSRQKGKVLVSGGGAAHPVLMNCLQQNSTLTMLKAENTVMEFKEALIFGLLGLLHHLGVPNVLGMSTGASFNHRSGSRIG